MATGDDHYTDLASLLNAHFKSGKPDFDVLICGNDRAAFVAYQVLGEGYVSAGCRRNGL